MSKDVFVIGAGAAGFFAALRIKSLIPSVNVHIFEKAKQGLSKVKISGGGRCNVTHACFVPKELIEAYPRGKKELLGPLHHFQPGDMLQWLAERGVETHIEEDGRIFPSSNSSQTIIDCFINEADKLGVEVHYQYEWSWEELSQAHAVLFATGASELMWKELEQHGIPCVPRVPSLFTFNIANKNLNALSGISMPQAEVTILNTEFSACGPLLITHWGISGPAVLKLSSHAALALASEGYHFQIEINWIGQDVEVTFEQLKEIRMSKPKQLPASHTLYGIPSRLWSFILDQSNIPHVEWANLSNAHLLQLANSLCKNQYVVNGKSTFKDEFVTAGGVDLKHIQFTTMEHKLQNNWYFAGEVLNIDAVTGGYNFQNAWTTAWIAAQAIASKLDAEE
ncbi:MAG: aminoacetone oxidase family FAD-binding enzyme [Bacteroidota bacterium]